MLKTNFGGYDAEANGQADNGIQDTARRIRSLFHNAGTPPSFWDVAAKQHTDIVDNYRTSVGGVSNHVEPILAERCVRNARAHREDSEKRISSPPWRWTCFGLLAAGHPESELRIVGSA